MTDRTTPLWLVAAPFVFLGLWSTGYVAAKFGLAYIEPMTFLSLRFAVIVAIMSVVYLVLRPPLPGRPADWGHLVITSVLIHSMYFGGCYMAFKSGVAVGTLALLMSLQPILIGLVAPMWTGERVGWKRWGGLGLGLAGAVVVITARSAIEAPSPIGYLYAVLALVGICGGSLWEKRFGVSHHIVTSTLIGCGVGLLGVMPFMLALESMTIVWSVELAGSLAYVVVGSSIISVALLTAMIRAGDVSRVSALFFLVPPLAAVVAWFVLGEVMPPAAWAGMVIAGVGVYIATRD